jgi:hypothetical protein
MNEERKPVEIPDGYDDGPWDAGFFGHDIHNAKGEPIAMVSPQRDSKANRHLIALAPALAEELKALRERVEELEGGYIEAVEEIWNARAASHGDFRGGPARYCSEHIRILGAAWPGSLGEEARK